MGESYVRPVVGATEPGPAWIPVWRFRVVAVLLLALAAVATVWGVNKLNHLSEQNPTSGVPSAPATSNP